MPATPENKNPPTKTRSPGQKTPSVTKIANALRGHTPEPIGKYRYYSVLLPLVEKDGEPHILYEVRTRTLAVQPGEICFPGGAIEAGELPEAAAVRETAEELGIPENSIISAAELNYIVTYSNFTMYCFLGILDFGTLEKSQPNPDEVEETFLVPLAWLLENEPDVYHNDIVPRVSPEIPMEKITKTGRYPWRTGSAAVPIYTFENRVIWGLTARLTWDFTKLVREIASTSS